MNTKTFITLASAFLLVFAWALPAQGRDWYIRAGSSGDGTKAKPYPTLHSALERSTAGDVIHVAQGIYYGEGGGGIWRIRVNNLALVGGYNRDFSDRNPFKYRTILMRALSKGAGSPQWRKKYPKEVKAMTKSRASHSAQPMISGSKTAPESHENTVVDGFILDGQSRNFYKSDGDLRTDQATVRVPLITFSQTGCAVRNCVVINSAGPAIRIAAQGKPGDPKTYSEVSNCVIANCLMLAVDCRVGRGEAIIENNTILFVWPHLYMGSAIYVGKDTRLTVRNNIFAYTGKVAIYNGLQNRRLRLIGNSFWNEEEGVYRYFSTQTGLTITVDNPKVMTGETAKIRLSLSRKSRDNIRFQPNLPYDPQFFLRLTNTLKQRGSSKISWDKVNQRRTALSLPLVTSDGKGPKNFAPYYDRRYLDLFATSKELFGKGASAKAKFASYKSQEKAVKRQYQNLAYKEMKENKFFQMVKATGLTGKGVHFETRISNWASSGFYLPHLNRDNYVIYVAKDKWLILYVKKGSYALRDLERAKKENLPVEIWGGAYDISGEIKSKGRIAVVVDKVVLRDVD